MLVTQIFQAIATARCIGITSVITLGEVLVQPLIRGDTRLQTEYRDLLLHSENLETFPIDSVAAEAAAGLRARYRIRMPDALQIAVAIGAGCEAFLTNDTAVRRVTELRVLILAELESWAASTVFLSPRQWTDTGATLSGFQASSGQPSTAIISSMERRGRGFRSCAG